MSHKLLLPWLSLSLVLPLCPQPRKYDGPRPPKPDIPYLVLAGNLVQTEVADAREDNRQKEVTYTIPGASSPAKTPLAEPIFVFLSSRISPEDLQCYRLEVKGGNRQAVFNKKKRKEGARPLRFLVTRLEDNLYKLEANQELENGEYSLSPTGSNQVFCFQIY